MLRKLFYGLLLVIVGVLVYAGLQSPEYTITREITEPPS